MAIDSWTTSANITKDRVFRPGGQSLHHQAYPQEPPGHGRRLTRPQSPAPRPGKKKQHQAPGVGYGTGGVAGGSTAGIGIYQPGIGSSADQVEHGSNLCRLDHYPAARQSPIPVDLGRHRGIETEAFGDDLAAQFLQAIFHRAVEVAHGLEQAERQNGWRSL